MWSKLASMSRWDWLNCNNLMLLQPTSKISWDGCAIFREGSPIPNYIYIYIHFFSGWHRHVHNHPWCVMHAFFSRERHRFQQLGRSLRPCLDLFPDFSLRNELVSTHLISNVRQIGVKIPKLLGATTVGYLLGWRMTSDFTTNVTPRHTSRRIFQAKFPDDLGCSST